MEDCSVPAVFSNALILAAVRIECTRVICCRKNLPDWLARVNWLPAREKDVIGQLSVACSGLDFACQCRQSCSDTFGWKKSAVTSVASVKLAARCFLWFSSNHSYVFKRQYWEEGWGHLRHLLGAWLVSPCGASGAGHWPRGDPGERWRRDYFEKRDLYTGGGSHSGGRLVNKAWKSWEAILPRRGAEGTRKQCAHETNVAKCWWVSFRIRWFGIMYGKINVRRKRGPARGTRGSLESHSPMLVLPLRRRSENGMWRQQIVAQRVQRIGKARVANLGATQST